MSFLDNFLKSLNGNVEYSYPTGMNPMAQRSLDYFMPKDAPMVALNAPMAAASPVDLSAPRIPEKAALASFAQQPEAQQMQQPQSQIPEPYNMLERVFLGFGGQGGAVKADQERYQLAKLAQSIPPADPFGAQLQQYALQSPEGAKMYLEYALGQQKAKQPNWQVKEVNGKLVRYDANNPTQVEGLSGQGGIGADVKGEGDLRKEFDGLQKDFRTVQDGYTRLEAAATDPSPAGDLALIFSYMKILDPGSTVREGEFANAQNATSVPGAVLNAYNKALTGERLNPEMRADFVGKAKSLYQAQAKTFNKTASKYRDLAKEYGYNPERITKEVAIDTAPPKYKEGQRARWPDGSIKTFINGKWQ